MPSLSAYFLLIGRVSLLTSVPSGYRMNVKGEFSFSARRASQERPADSCRRSEAQERARKMKL